MAMVNVIPTVANDLAPDKNYHTGKFCHIYRPKVIGSPGKEVWCDLFIENFIKMVSGKILI